MTHGHDLPFVGKRFSTADDVLDGGCYDDEDGGRMDGSMLVHRDNGQSRRGRVNNDTFRKEKKNTIEITNEVENECLPRSVIFLRYEENMGT